MALHPYLNFGGNCREAFTRYQAIFGGVLVLLPMSEMPSDMEVPAGRGDLIMHAARTFNGQSAHGVRWPLTDFAPVQGMYVNYSLQDVAEAERVFEALAEGGE